MKKLTRMYYILKKKIPVECSFLEWANWFETKAEQCRVALTEFPDDVIISTIFIGLNHFYSETKPLLFETMIFGGEFDQYVKRYSTWDEAEAGHKKAIDLYFHI